ncbi:Clavaminate synthase-like protein [Annulohypoxylon truncatum]|uniref:Clavaminate synthase-like protein n=1 Tax=Annulohypoxylon truncatum TaxID=327061 RepID=UPI002007E205|nr:Clavaminate synthase-like protein [Annulohypoxylon truncatum]KAI1204572.1 Clavaminate synthase-like protein [Annulohypoxylon truncatum]
MLFLFEIHICIFASRTFQRGKKENKNMTAHIVPLVSESLVGLQTWVRQQEHGLAAGTLSRQQSSIPGPSQQLPGSIGGPLNWSRLDSVDKKVKRLELTASDISEIDRALEAFNGLELDGDEVTRERFPLPNLESQLEQCALEVHRGIGLCIIRGLKPERYSVEDNIVLFLGLSSFIGDQRGLQNSKGDMLSHVTESKSWTAPKEKRHGIHTNDSLPFHNDMGCEVLAIQVRDRAEAGGHTCVASMTAIYNALMQSNPWVLHTLARHDWPIQTSRRAASFVLSPLLEYYADNLLISMDPARIGPHPLARNGSVPQLTAEQREALAVLQDVARKNQLRLETQPGDIIFLNNLGLLHARESYQDSASSSRHLVRLWLRNKRLGWAIPPSMRMPWEASFGDGAARVVNRYYPIMPMPEYMECKYSNGTAAFVADDDEGDEVIPKTIEDGTSLERRGDT